MPDYYVKVPCVGFVEVLVVAENEDDVAEQAMNLCRDEFAVVIKGSGTVTPENYAFEFIDEVSDAHVESLEIEAMEAE